MARTVEEIRASKREHMARRRAENPEAARQYQREFHAKNREQNCANMRDYYARRFFWGRAMKLRGKGHAGAKDLWSIWKRQRGLCALTGRRLDRTAHVDHILPKTRGGGDEAKNLRWICAEVNLAKRNLTEDEFSRLCKDVMEWIGRRIELVEGMA